MYRDGGGDASHNIHLGGYENKNNNTKNNNKNNNNNRRFTAGK
jgi:hypothetical protein